MSVSLHSSSRSQVVLCLLFALLVAWFPCSARLFICYCTGFRLAERCNCIAMFGYCHNMSPVCRLSVTRVYCDKMIEARITACSLNSRKLTQLTFSVGKFGNKVRRGPCDLWASNYGGVVLDLAALYLGNGAR